MRPWDLMHAQVRSPRNRGCCGGSAVPQRSASDPAAARRQGAAPATAAAQPMMSGKLGGVCGTAWQPTCGVVACSGRSSAPRSRASRAAPHAPHSAALSAATAAASPTGPFVPLDSC